MKLPRRNFLHLAAGAAALPAVSDIARAQAYPTRPVRIIIGFPAGTTADIIARLLGQWLSERLGQPGSGQYDRDRSRGPSAGRWPYAPLHHSGEPDQHRGLRQ